MNVFNVKRFAAIFFTAFFTLFSHTSLASFIDSEIQLQVFFPNESSPISSPLMSTVGSHIEFTGIDAAALPGFRVADVQIDLSGNRIVWDFTNTGGFTSFPAASFNGHILSDVNGTIPTITGIAVNRDESTFDIGMDRLYFNEDQLFLNVQGLSIPQGGILSADVTFVPLPAAAWLFGTALLGLFNVATKKRR